MKRIKAPVDFELVFGLCLFIAFATIKNADAGEYFIYRNPKGNLVLSNSTPPAGSDILKREALPEVTNQQIAESRARNEKLQLDNRLASLEKAIDQLSANLHAQTDAIESLQQSSSDGNIAVGVTQGPGIVPTPSRGHLPRHPRNDFHHAPQRGTIPSPLHQRLGAKGRS